MATWAPHYCFNRKLNSHECEYACSQNVYMNVNEYIWGDDDWWLSGTLWRSTVDSKHWKDKMNLMLVKAIKSQSDTLQ